MIIRYRSKDKKPYDNKLYRATCIIVDESRLVKKSVLNEVIRPFLNFVRMPNFLNKKEYADKKHLYMEENKEVYLTSCGKYCPA